jgi:hypothetical protein
VFALSADLDKLHNHVIYKELNRFGTVMKCYSQLTEQHTVGVSRGLFKNIVTMFAKKSKMFQDKNSRSCPDITPNTSPSGFTLFNAVSA